MASSVKEKPEAAAMAKRVLVRIETKGVSSSMTQEAAAALVQRWHRGLAARKRMRLAQQEGVVGVAGRIAEALGGAVGGIIDNVLLAPLNLASESLINSLLGNMLSVLVKGYSRAKPIPIRTGTGGIEIGGPEGLYLDDEALAALMGGMSPYTNVYISKVRLRLPMLHARQRVEVEIGELRATMLPVATELSRARKAELDAKIKGAQPKKAQQAEAKEARDKERKASGKKGAAVDDDDYSPMEKAVDGLYMRIQKFELKLPQYTELPTEAHEEEEAAETSALLATATTPGGANLLKSLQLKQKIANQAKQRARRAMQCTLGCFTCVVRPISLCSCLPALSFRNLFSRRQSNEEERVAKTALVPMTIVRINGLELQNCKPDFSESHALVPRVVHRDEVGCPRRHGAARRARRCRPGGARVQASGGEEDARVHHEREGRARAHAAAARACRPDTHGQEQALGQDHQAQPGSGLPRALARLAGGR
mmetsp:Transcript_17869/g.45731  ORF Transcript_17869/g.45731 Transcript_17869/m.45731 type:complete len:482 (+) Transcript_17869:149-1594(+)